MTGAAAEVSVVTPAFRVESLLGATIESVLAQTFPDFEMLIVDDCSPDHTADVAADFARRDPRVRLLRLDRNSGPAGARNRALEAAVGRYVAFLDGDDLWLPEKLARHLAFVRETGAAVSYSQYRRIDRDGRVISALIDVPARLDYGQLLRNTAIVTSTVIVDRSVTGPIRMRPLYYDDYVLWLELLKRGHVAHGFREDTARYRVLGGSWSRNKLRSARQVWRIYRDVERLNWWPAVSAFRGYAWNALRKYSR